MSIYSNARIGCLVWVRFGWRGARQLAHVNRTFDRTGDLVVHKWRHNSRAWSGPLIVSPVDVLSEDVDLVDPIVQIALKAATPGRPPCHHKFHFIPQVKLGGSPRQVVHA